MSQTQKLVEQDHVFAIFNSIGTEHALAVRELPEPAEGAAAVRRQRRGGDRQQHAKYPWTIGLLPSFDGRGRDLRPPDRDGHPNAKIGVLYENDEYGKELLAGLKRGLGSHAGQIVATASRTRCSTRPSTSQVQQLKAAGADTFVIFALPTQAIQAFVVAVASSAGSRRSTSRRCRSTPP